MKNQCRCSKLNSSQILDGLATVEYTCVFAVRLLVQFYDDVRLFDLLAGIPYMLYSENLGAGFDMLIHFFERIYFN